MVDGHGAHQGPDRVEAALTLQFSLTRAARPQATLAAPLADLERVTRQLYRRWNPFQFSDSDAVSKGEIRTDIIAMRAYRSLLATSTTSTRTEFPVGTA